MIDETNSIWRKIWNFPLIAMLVAVAAFVAVFARCSSC